MLGVTHMGRLAPALVRLGLFGLTSAQYRKLLRHSPVPGTTTAEPNGLPRLCVMQIALPSRSATDSDVVWLSAAAPPGGGAVHCSVGPSTGLPSLTRLRSFSTCASDNNSATLGLAAALLAMRTPAAIRMARHTVSRCSTPLRSIFEKSKPSRMRRVSRNWNPSHGGGGILTVSPR